jgi:hypothetical protein
VCWQVVVVYLYKQDVESFYFVLKMELLRSKLLLYKSRLGTVLKLLLYTA